MSDSTLPFDGWIRVSRKNGREGASYRSPEDQQADIETLAREFGLTVGEIVIREDLSGSKAQKDPEMIRLVEKVKAGKSGGLLVFNVKRYSRNKVTGLRTALDIMEAGGRIIATNFKHEGKFALTILTMLLEEAEDDLDQKTESWRRSSAASVGRGMHSGSKPPTGYEWERIEIPNGRFKKTGGLVPSSDAPKVTAAFQGFADGSLSKADVQHLVGYAHQARVDHFLSNTAYIGVAKWGDVETPDSHPPLVERKVWDAVQHRLAVIAAKPKPKRRSTSTWAILHGVVRCPHCGKGLTPSEVKVGGKKRYKHGCTVGPGVYLEQTDELIEVVTQAALRWHALMQPRYAVAWEAERTMLKPMEDALLAAVAERDEAEHSPEISELNRAKALTAYDAKIAGLHREIAQIESTQGWLTVTPERVQERIKDPEQRKLFLRETVVVDVAGVGRGRRKAGDLGLDRLTFYGRNPQSNGTVSSVPLALVFDSEGQYIEPVTVVYDPPLAVTVEYAGFCEVVQS